MKKLISMILALVFVSSATVAFAAVPDAINHWSNEVVSKAENSGWLDIRSDGNFYPDELATREEVFYMTYAALLSQNVFDTNAETPAFTDSSQIKDKYKKATEVLIGNSIVNGYPDNTVRPENHITRAEAATIMSSLIPGSVSLTSYYTPFMDELPDWAKLNIERCARAGIITGYPNHTFKPNDNITRAEIVVMVSKLSELNLAVPTTTTTTTEATTETTTEKLTETTTAELTETTTKIVVDEERARELVEYINNERYDESIANLEINKKLNKLATSNAVNMAKNKTEEEQFGEYRNLDEMLSENDISFNVATIMTFYGVDFPLDAMGMIDSMQDRYDKIIDHNYDSIGVGYCEGYWAILLTGKY